VTLAEFCEKVHTYCSVMDASVTSWKRSMARNRQVDGVPHSAHVVGLAVDVVYDQAIPVPQRGEWARRLGLRLIAESDHDHLQPDEWQAG